MGTRSDYYVGRGENAEWLGSLPFDGYPSARPEIVLQAKSEAAYRNAVETMFGSEERATTPEMGWPWPWNNSGTTDYAYAFEDEQVWVSRFGSPWVPADVPEPEDWDAVNGEPATFPDMADRKNVTFGPRSGLIVVGFPGGVSG